jgi:hypothetical protein
MAGSLAAVVESTSAPARTQVGISHLLVELIRSLLVRRFRFTGSPRLPAWRGALTRTVEPVHELKPAKEGTDRPVFVDEPSARGARGAFEVEDDANALATRSTRHDPSLAIAPACRIDEAP